MDELFDKKKLNSFWPSKYQQPRERILATMRFVIYTSLLIFVIRRDVRILVFGAGVLFLLYNMLTPPDKIQEKQSEIRTDIWKSDGSGEYAFNRSFYKPPENDLGPFLQGAYPTMFRPRCRDDSTVCDQTVRINHWPAAMPYEL
jgi:hypothetical protein